MKDSLSGLTHLLPFLAVLVLVVGVLSVLHWLLIHKRPELNAEERLPRQLIMLAATLIGLLVVVLALPVAEATRNQVIALIGVLVSGVLAFSSTTLMSNFVAGLMLRLNKPFKTGDFVQVDQHFGRVSARGLLDTEIQSEHRELIAIPNTVLVTRPVSVISATGAIISAQVSLGYDLPHGRIETQLLAAAEDIGLTDAFVQVTELGNFSVGYRVSGLLTDVKSLLTTKSNLHRAVLDRLHADDIEIVSPSFMNQRQLAAQGKVLAKAVVEPVTGKPVQAPEDIIFDKAEAAEQVENEVAALQHAIEDLQGRLKQAEGEEKQRLAEAIATKQSRLEALTQSAT